MNMCWIDWIIVTMAVTVLIVAAITTKKYTRSVVDFLSANRCAGRYVLCISEGIAAVGAITFVAYFEMLYKAGFAVTWWIMLGWPVYMFVTLSGWVIYRYRQTRALTMAQFFELRYSKRFRFFCGLLAFFAGIIHFGIFPAVGSRFFIYFCGFPDTLYGVSTFVLVMLILLAISLFLTLMGGQIAVIVTDFLQGMFCNIVFVIIGATLLIKFDWSNVFETLSTALEGKSMLNPFHTSEVKDFNMWFWLITYFGLLYTWLAWQANQGYNSSAKSPHEARMAKILGTWRGISQGMVIVLIPVCAYTVMHHQDYTSIAENVRALLNTIPNDATNTIKEQVTVSVVMAEILPKGILGAFCGVMLLAFISTHDTQMHSWASIFVQDVVLPFRKKPFGPEQHLRLLRCATVGVTIFIFFFSLLFKQTQYIMMFWAITGAIFTGGAGAVIIGGLYWGRGTTAAAWSAMITGSTLAVSGVIIHQMSPKFFINGQVMWFIAMVSSLTVYFIVSLLGKKNEFNIDKMLHRGKYAIQQNPQTISTVPVRGWKAFGIGKEFSKGDKIIYFSILFWLGGWFVGFLIITVYNLTHDVSEKWWSTFWRFRIWLYFFVGIITTVWLAVGGIHDLQDMFRTLRTAKRNYKDDGTVVDHRNLGDSTDENEQVSADNKNLSE